MAKFTLDNTYLSISTTEYSNNVKSITLADTRKELTATGMQQTGEVRAAGRRDCYARITFWSDFADSGLNEVLWTAYAAGTALALVIKPNGDTTAATNPKWSFNGMIFEMPIVDGSTDDSEQATISIEFKLSDGTPLARVESD